MINNDRENTNKDRAVTNKGGEEVNKDTGEPNKYRGVGKHTIHCPCDKLVSREMLLSHLRKPTNQEGGRP